MFKVKIYISYNYGGWSINFEKEFELPFAPYYDLVLLDNSNNAENNISLVNNDYQITLITYDVVDNSFFVDIRNRWKYPVSDETIDDLIKTFTQTDWIRTDTTDLNKLKELMLREFNRVYNRGTTGNRGEIQVI
jgi:hypothetical protein